MNHEQIKLLSDEEINRRIHKNIMGECVHEKRAGNFCCIDCGSVGLRIPNYAQNLNAVAKAEKLVIEKVGSKYSHYLQDAIRSTPTIPKDWCTSVATATARQRSEAALLALTEGR